VLSDLHRDPQRGHILLVVDPAASLAPAPLLGWPPPGGFPLRAPATIAGVSQRGTALDMGAASGTAAAAPQVLRLPGDAGDAFLQLQLITLGGLGHGPLLVGGDGGWGSWGGNASNATSAARPGPSRQARRVLSKAAPASGGAAAAADALAYPEPGCWVVLLWGVNRNGSAASNSSGAVALSSVRLLLPAAEYDAVARRAAAAGGDFELRPASEAPRGRAVRSRPTQIWECLGPAR
jgi:hypothetical protein